MFLKNRLATALGERHAGKRIRKRHILQALEKLSPNSKVILDAGCGGGEYVSLIAKKYPMALIDGIDIDSNQYRLCYERQSEDMLDNINFVLGDLTKPFGTNKYDLIYSVDVLEHVEDDQQVLKNMFEALKMDGQLVIHVPLVCEHLFQRIENLPGDKGHVRDGYKVEELFQKLQKSGFGIKKSRYTFNKLKGGLAWEIWRSCSQSNKFIRVAIHLMVMLLAWLDGIGTNKHGAGILVIGEKGDL